jgi:hypothetical protein
VLADHAGEDHVGGAAEHLGPDHVHDDAADREQDDQRDDRPLGFQADEQALQRRAEADRLLGHALAHHRPPAGLLWSVLGPFGRFAGGRVAHAASSALSCESTIST